MSERPEALRKMLDELAERDGMPTNAAAIIDAAVTTSSDLRARLVKAAQRDPSALDHIEVAPPKSHTGGFYDGVSNTLHIASEVFTADMLKEDRIDYVSGVMGHEISHALLETDRNSANETFRLAVRNAVAKGDDLASVDLTRLTGDYLTYARHDESVSEIGGFNAISSRVTDGNGGKVDLDEILRRAYGSTSFVIETDGKYRLAEGITHGADGKISAAKMTVDGKLVENPNIEAVAKVHFDQSRRSLGQGGATDYRNYYGAAALEIIADEVQTYRQQNQGIAPDPKLDFTKLGLDAAQQASGLNLDLGKERGKDVRGFTFLDSSHGGLEQRVFHHSRTPGRSTAQPDNDPAAERAVSTSPADFGHPDHATLEQIRAGVRAASGQIGAHDDASVERLSRSLLAATKDQRDAYPHTRDEPLAGRELGRVDQVVVGGGNCSRSRVGPTIRR